LEEYSVVEPQNTQNAAAAQPQSGDPAQAAAAQTSGMNAAPSADAASNDSNDKKIQELEAQLKEKDQKYVYLYAEFENYKKRAIKERSDAMKFGWENVARDLLQVTDNLERGLAHMPAGTDKNLADGLTMTLQQFRNTLQKQGVQLIETKGQPFNPELHDAVAQEPSELPAGTITQEQLKGYTLHGRLLRPASVIVSSGPLAK
jgi:molecular chaperone GrpE